MKYSGGKSDNLKDSFAKSPPVQSMNIQQEKKTSVISNKKIFSAQAAIKIAVASVESFVPQFAGGIYIY